jgi:hypothetical protein
MLAGATRNSAEEAFLVEESAPWEVEVLMAAVKQGG